MIDVSLLGGSIDLIKSSQKFFGGLRASPFGYTGTPNCLILGLLGVSVYARGEALRPQKIFESSLSSQ